MDIRDTYAILEVGLEIDEYHTIKNSANDSQAIIFNQNDERPWMCGICEKTFLKRCYLRWHLRNECGRPPTYVCDLCKYSTYIKSHFKRHLAKGSCGRATKRNVNVDI